MLSLLRRNRDFRLVITAQVISYAGDWFATVALLGLVIDLTHSDLAAALVFVSQTLPSFLVTPLAGPAADRFDRRRLMIGVSVVQVGCALMFLLVGEGTAWLAFVAQGSISALAAFFQPASQAALPNLVDPEDLPTATVMMSATWGAMLAVGAAVGAAFTVAFGREASFVADAASFAIAALLLLGVRRSMNGARSAHVDRMRPLADTAEGLRYARRHSEVLALLSSKMGFGLSAGVTGMLAVLATQRFHAGDTGTGILLAARGVGVVVGPFLIRRAVARGTSTILLACGVSALVFSAGYAVVSVSTMLGVAAVAVLVAHLGGGAQWTASTYGLQVTTRDEFRGRIFATDFALVTLTMSVSLTISGLVAETVGPGPVVAVLAGLSAVWASVYLFCTRRLRATERAIAAADVS
ncbi:MAG TPA: MFS transporter [Acidimicrobiia bacterium]|nr:MFS transporter [Acidimicrobiia bacterium]